MLSCLDGEFEFISTTLEDIARDDALDQLHYDAVMKRVTREQCIFLFVEGECEANTVGGLLFDDVEFESLGIQVANYNGRGNLPAMLKFLQQTLSFDRPIILTHDNDPESLKSIETCRKRNLLTDLVHPFPIPNQPVVKYP